MGRIMYHSKYAWAHEDSLLEFVEKRLFPFLNHFCAQHFVWLIYLYWQTLLRFSTCDFDLLNCVCWCASFGSSIHFIILRLQPTRACAHSHSHKLVSSAHREIIAATTIFSLTKNSNDYYLLQLPIETLFIPWPNGYINKAFATNANTHITAWRVRRTYCKHICLRSKTHVHGI